MPRNQIGTKMTAHGKGPFDIFCLFVFKAACQKVCDLFGSIAVLRNNILLHAFRKQNIYIYILCVAIRAKTRQSSCYSRVLALHLLLQPATLTTNTGINTKEAKRNKQKQTSNVSLSDKDGSCLYLLIKTRETLGKQESVKKHGSVFSALQLFYLATTTVPKITLYM